MTDDNDTTDLLSAALQYGQDGARIFPASPANKRPMIKAYHDAATSDADQIRAWWTRWPNAMIAARIPDDMLVIDIDPKHNGHSTWEALGGDNIASGLRHASGRNDGGRHHWYGRPDGLKPSTVRLDAWARDRGLGEATAGDGWTGGIDVLTSTHRYSILPPSLHPDTREPYWWDAEGEPDELPAILVELLSPPAPQPARPAPTRRADPDAGETPADWFTRTARWSDVLAGWTVVHGDGESDGSLWRHPTATADSSASIRHGCLFAYSTSLPLASTGSGDPRGYTKFAAYSELHHGGDQREAASTIRRTMMPVEVSSSTTTPKTPPNNVDADTGEISADDDPEQWPEPIAISEDDRPTFPTDIFPAWISDQVAQASTEMQLPPDLAAQLAITALSIVTAGRVEIRINGRWKEPTNTYLVTCLPPSAGKSPTVGMMTGALDKWEEELGEKSAQLIDDRDIDRRHLEKLRDDALKRAEISEAKAYGDQLRDMPVIAAPRLMADDATPEKLIDLLSEQGGRMALVSTEGGMFGMMAGRYSDQANLDVYLGAWSGDTIRVDRMGRGSTVVRRPRLTIGVTVQPDVLVQVGRNREMVGRGVLARLMTSLPTDTVGRRDKQRESTYSETVQDTYERHLLAIARELADLPDNEPHAVEMTPDARRTFLAWTAGREALLAPYAPLRHMAEWIAKCDSTTARVAALLHVAWGDEGEHVSAERVSGAIEVGNYWTSHASATFDLMGASNDLGHARFLHGWLGTRSAPTVTFREMHQHAKKRVESAADLLPAVELLIEHGWLRLEGDGALSTLIGKGKQSPSLRVHPSLRLSLTVPHIPHISPETENDPPQSENVRDVRPVSQEMILEHTLSQFAEGGMDTRNPGLTSLTSDDRPTLADVEGLY